MNPFDQIWALQLLIVEDEKRVNDLHRKAALLSEREPCSKARSDLQSELRTAEDKLSRNREHLSMLTQKSS